MLQASQQRFEAKMASVEHCSKVVRTKLEVIVSPSACSITAQCTAFWGHCKELRHSVLLAAEVSKLLSVGAGCLLLGSAVHLWPPGCQRA